MTDINYFDGYNHEEMKKTIPLSSLLMFDGEDLNWGDRKLTQQLQQKQWIQQQSREKQDRLDQELQERKDFEAYTLELNQMRKALEEEHNQKRKQMLVACKQTNIQQQAEKTQSEKYREQQDQVEKQMHKTYVMETKFMQEDTGTCQSQLAPHRVIPYHWKGMNQYQKNDVMYTREVQICQKQEKQDLDNFSESLYAQQNEQLRLMTIKLEREKQKKLKEKMIQTKDFNLLGLTEQKRQNQYY